MIKIEFESLKTLRDQLSRTLQRIQDINNSIGILEVAESNGMPRSVMSEHTSDTQRKLELLLKQAEQELLPLWTEYSEKMIVLDDKIKQAELSPEQDLTLRKYYLSVEFQTKTNIFEHVSIRSLAKELHIEPATVQKRLNTAFEKIGKK